MNPYAAIDYWTKRGEQIIKAGRGLPINDPYWDYAMETLYGDDFQEDEGYNWAAYNAALRSLVAQAN